MGQCREISSYAHLLFHPFSGYTHIEIQRMPCGHVERGSLLQKARREPASENKENRREKRKLSVAKKIVPTNKVVEYSNSLSGS